MDLSDCKEDVIRKCKCSIWLLFLIIFMCNTCFWIPVKSRNQQELYPYVGGHKISIHCAITLPEVRSGLWVLKFCPPFCPSFLDFAPLFAPLFTIINAPFLFWNGLAAMLYLYLHKTIKVGLGFFGWYFMSYVQLESVLNYTLLLVLQSYNLLLGITIYY